MLPLKRSLRVLAIASFLAGLLLIGFVLGRITKPEVIAHITATLVATFTPSPTETSTPVSTHTAVPESTSPPPPVAEVPWPDPRTVPGPSKASLHVVWNNDPFIMEFVRRMRPAVLKTVDDTGFLMDVKAASPTTMTVGRFTGDPDINQVQGIVPEQYARQYVDERLERYRLNPGVEFWEGFNEYRPATTTAWDWFARFEAERACYMASKGLKAAVGSFSTGVPEYHEMPLFLPALQAVQQCGGIFTLHEYAAPYLQCGVSNGAPAIIPNAPAFPSIDLGITTLRYRFWYEGYLKPLGLGDVRLVISEMGIDGGAQFCHLDEVNGAGWNDYRAWWMATGRTTDSIAYYLDQVKWYDSQVRQDPYVVGFTLYTAGDWSADISWNLHELILPLAHYLAEG